MDNQQVTPFELGWLVGIIDGEGSVGISKRNRQGAAKLGFTLKPHIQISNSDLELIAKAADILKRLGVAFHVSNHTGIGRRRNHQTIVIAGLKRVSKALPIFAPHLTNRKAIAARYVQEFINSRLSDWHAAPFTFRQLELVNLCAEANHVGTGEHKARLNLRDYTRSLRSTKLSVRRVPQEDRVQTSA
jgi:hypothetical protein